MTDPLPPIDPFRAGQRQLSAADLNAIVEALRQVAGVQLDGLDGEYAGGRLHLKAHDRPDVFLARITAVSSGSYGWVEVRPADTASGYEDLPDGRSGTTSADPAKGLNGGVASVDDLVVVFPGWHTLSGGAVTRGWRLLADPDAALNVRGWVNAANQHLGAGIKAVSALMVGGLADGFPHLFAVQNFGLTSAALYTRAKQNGGAPWTPLLHEFGGPIVVRAQHAATDWLEWTIQGVAARLRVRRSGGSVAGQLNDALFVWDEGLGSLPGVANSLMRLFAPGRVIAGTGFSVLSGGVEQQGLTGTDATGAEYLGGVCTKLTPAGDLGYDGISGESRLVGINGEPLTLSGTPGTNHVLTYTGAEWTAQAVPAPGAGSIGTSQLADGSVTTAKLADANVTAAKLASDVAVCPRGTIVAYGGSTAPTGWLLCDGAAVSRTTYAGLFALLGTAFGAGNGSTTFNLPDLRGRAPIGAGTGSGLSARTLGATGGAETHTLTVTEMPVHTHDTVLVAGGSGSPANVTIGGGGYGLRATATAGAGGSHNNMPPWQAVTFIIKE